MFLVNGQTGKHTQELRTLKFWFRNFFGTEQATLAQEFFRDLIQPQDFPKNYVGFIKKIMKLLQYGFKDIVKIELVLRLIEESDVSEIPRKYI